MLVDEIVESGQLSQADLATKLVETGDTPLAVPDDVERGHVDLGVESRSQVQVLQELRMIPQRQRSQPLAAHGQRPIGQAAAVHRIGRLAAKRIDHGDLFANFVRVFVQCAELEQIRHQGMQAIDADEFLGEVERRAEMIGLVEADDSAPCGERGEQLISLFRIRRLLEHLSDIPRELGEKRLLSKTPTSLRSWRDRAARHRSWVWSILWCESWRFGAT